MGGFPWLSSFFIALLPYVLFVNEHLYCLSKNLEAGFFGSPTFCSSRLFSLSCFLFGLPRGQSHVSQAA